MGRPRKGTEDTFYDTFAEWAPDDRAVALKVLEQTHRQLLKVENKTSKPTEQSRLELMASGNKAEE